MTTFTFRNNFITHGIQYIERAFFLFCFFCSITPKLIYLLHIHQTNNLLLYFGLRLRCGDCQVNGGQANWRSNSGKSQHARILSPWILSCTVSSSDSRSALVIFRTCLNCVWLSPVALMYWSCTTCKFFNRTSGFPAATFLSYFLHVLSWFCKQLCSFFLVSTCPQLFCSEYLELTFGSLTFSFLLRLCILTLVKYTFLFWGCNSKK